jgi:sec-independent protein translocase protein TatC
MSDCNEKDLFADSTMTFGEHLEELRGCLWRAVLGLLVGFVVGLFLGAPVVNLIQLPLTNALTYYYQIETESKLKEAGIKSGKTEQSGANSAIRYGDEGKMLADEVFLDPIDLLAQLKSVYPERFGDMNLSQAAGKGNEDEKLIPVLIWRRAADDTRIRSKSFNAHEAFTIYIKAALLVGLLVSGPWIFYQIWTFVAAGLYPHEKKYIHIYLPLSVGLFFFGAVVAFCFVFEPVLNFLFSFNRWLGIDPDPRISEWMGFVLFLPVGFGIGFQLPLVMFFLERVGIVSSGMFSKHWRLAIFIIWVLASILTPPDPYSQFFLGIPLTVLYFGGLLLCKYTPSRRRRFEEFK